MPSFTVTGPAYKGHAPGSTFEAERDESIERAIARGSIVENKPQVEEAVKKVTVESHKRR